MHFTVFNFAVRHFRSTYSLVLALIFITGVSVSASAQNIGNMEREYGRSMLSMIQSDVEKNYYDPNFRGIDLKARFKTADDRIKQAKSNGEIYGIIAQVLLDFDDSHLFFSPPARAAEVNYGWTMQMVGDRCLITAVQPGTDAEKKGLKPGDQLLSMDGFQPNRDIFWKMQYLYNALKPRAATKLIVAAPDGAQRQIDIASQITQKAKQVDLTSNEQAVRYSLEGDSDRRLRRHRYVDGDDKIFIWRMPSFNMYDDADVDGMVAKAKKHDTFVIDLRGNGGGLVKMLQRLVGNLFDHDVKLWDEKRRKEIKPLVAKTRGNEVYKGKLVVIVDSRCGSAAELFARIVQLEKRGTVIGDQTSGSVMESLSFSRSVGMDVVVPYGVSVTIADLIMADGKSLEHVGVTPDELLLPTAADLAAGRDPVLARAAAILGVELSPEKAGKFFPVEWR